MARQSEKVDPAPARHARRRRQTRARLVQAARTLFERQAWRTGSTRSRTRPTWGVLLQPLREPGGDRRRCWWGRSPRAAERSIRWRRNSTNRRRWSPRRIATRCGWQRNPRVGLAGRAPDPQPRRRARGARPVRQARHADGVRRLLGLTVTHAAEVARQPLPLLALSL